MATDTIHARLRELIRFYNISQQDFAKKTGINYSSLSTYLSGRRKPKADKIEIIADAFDVDISWILGYDVPMKSSKVRPKEVNPDVIAEISTNKKIYELCADIVKLSDAELSQVSALIKTMLKN